MADFNGHIDPNNHNAFSAHYYYGGEKDGDPGRHGHVQLDQNGVVYHRLPTSDAVGSLAVRGILPETYRR